MTNCGGNLLRSLQTRRIPQTQPKPRPSLPVLNLPQLTDSARQDNLVVLMQNTKVPHPFRVLRNVIPKSSVLFVTAWWPLASVTLEREKCRRRRRERRPERLLSFMAWISPLLPYLLKVADPWPDGQLTRNASQRSHTRFM